MIWIRGASTENSLTGPAVISPSVGVYAEMKGYEHILSNFKRSHPLGDERGTGLVEILVTMAIAAIALTAFLLALSMGSFGVNTVRERVTAENLARTQLEIIKSSSYITGATPIAYTSQYAIATPPGYVIGVDVSYWYSHPTNSTFTTTAACDCDMDGDCATQDDKDCCCGMQCITVTIYHHRPGDDDPKSEPVFTVVDYKTSR
jgi:Tfp pilus assembly protein PilV